MHSWIAHGCAEGQERERHRKKCNKIVVTVTKRDKWRVLPPELSHYRFRQDGWITISYLTQDAPTVRAYLDKCVCVYIWIRDPNRNFGISRRLL